MKKIKNIKYLDIIKNNVDLIIVFLFPIIILSLTFLLLNVYPFGTRSIIDGDLYNQYLPIMTELKRSITNGDGFLYTFKAGLGTNFYSLNTYQNASPITLLFLLLFSIDNISLCVIMLIMFKIGLISSSMYYYLKNITKEKQNNISFAILMSLSTVYSLSGYSLAYYYNIMWLDALFILPIVILGMRRIINNKDTKLYIVSLAILLISNYYIGLITCIFLFLYFFVYYFSEGINNFKKVFKEIFISTFISFLISMFILLPTFFTLIKSYIVTTPNNQLNNLFYYPFSVHLAQLLPNSNNTLFYGPANIYSGLITLIFLFLYVFNKRISSRKKIIKILFILFIIISTNFKPFDLIWHLFHFPTGIPARYSFALTFIMIETIIEAFDDLKESNFNEIILAFISTISLYIIVLISKEIELANHKYMFLTGLIFLVLYFLSFSYILNKNTKESYFVLSLAIIFEIVFVSIRSFSVDGIVEKSNYFKYKDEIKYFINIAEKKDPYSRLEIIGTDNLNAPFEYGYKGLSLFASSVPSDTYEILSKIMYDKKANINSFKFDYLTVAPDTLFNIRYYISIDKELNNVWLNKIESINNCHLYENKYHSSIGYVLDKNSANIDFNKSKKEILNELIKINTNIENVVKDNNIDLDKWEEVYPKLFDELFVVDKMKNNIISGTINVKADSLFMSSIPYDESWNIKVDGIKINNINSIKYFLSFPIDKGNHFIEMVYLPKGLIGGTILSLIGISLFFIYINKFK